MTKAACHVILHFSSLCLTWRSIKSLKKSPHSMDVEILQLWSLLAFHTVAVQLGIERILSYIPFYYYFKMIVMFITFLPGTKFPNFWFEVVLVPGMEKVHRACDIDVAGYVKYHVKMLPLRVLDLLLLPGVVASHEGDGECRYDRVRKLREKQLKESCSSCPELVLTASSTDSSYHGSDLADKVTEVYHEGEKDTAQQTSNSQRKSSEIGKEGMGDSNGSEMVRDDMRTKLDSYREEKKRNSPARSKGPPVDRRVSPRTPTSTRRRVSSNTTSSSRSSTRRKTSSASRTNDELSDQLSPTKSKVTPARSHPSRRVSSGRKSTPSNLPSKPNLTPVVRRSSSISSPVARSRITASSMQLRQFSRVHPGHHVSPRSASSSPPFPVPPASAFKNQHGVTAPPRRGKGTPERLPLKPLSPRTKLSSTDNATPSRRVRRSILVDKGKDTAAWSSPRYSDRESRRLSKLQSEPSANVQRRRPRKDVENMSPQSTPEKEEEALLDESMSVKERLDRLMKQEEVCSNDDLAGETAKATLHNEERLSLGERIRSLVTGNVDIRIRDYFFDLDLPSSPSSHCTSRPIDFSFDKEEDDHRVKESVQEKPEESNENTISTKSVTLNDRNEEKERERARRDAAIEKHRKRMKSATPTRTGTVLHRHDHVGRRMERTKMNDFERHRVHSPHVSGGGHSRKKRSSNKGNIAEKQTRSIAGRSRNGNNESGQKDNVTLRRSKRIAQAKSERYH